MIDVVDPVADENLLTLEECKALLQVAGDEDDDWLRLQISQASAKITDFIGRPLGLERVEQTYRPERGADVVILDRWPVVEVHSIQSGGSPWTTESYEINRRQGLIRPLSGDRYCQLPHGALRVEYTAGFPSIPRPVKEACAMLVKMAGEALDRQVGVKSERLEQVASATYADPGVSGLPVEIETLLQRYKDGGVVG